MAGILLGENGMSGKLTMIARTKLMAAGLDGKVDFQVYKIQGTSPPIYKLVGSFQSHNKPARGAHMTTENYEMLESLVEPICDRLIAVCTN